MLVEFFFMLRRAEIPVSVTEFLSLQEGLARRVAGYSVDDFYYLARATLVKDERHFDRFDRVFGAHFQGLEELFDEVIGEIPEEWLRRQGIRYLSEEEKQRIEALGGWDKLMETLRERLAEQRERHQGGSKWIGTAGTSPFGAYGYNPEGVRIGQHESRHRRAVKVWDRREFRNLDDRVEIGTRNIKLALRRLRQFARQGAADELDLDDTIRSTARNAGLLDLKLVPERHNAVKVLLFLDVGGSMDEHVKICEELFSAARSEFKHLEHYYFHNFVYEALWKDNGRRTRERISTYELMHTYGADHKLIFIGDAAMSPYEIIHPGGSVEHWNEEPGAVWMGRLLATYPSAIWLNPEPEVRWEYTPSIGLTREIMGERMFPLTLAGLDRGIRELQKAGTGVSA
ncbi:MAG: VWA domain-containing protein [Gammaproteobacteria bacterium]|nr:VWA domain-containing protein [Gammaproteobacteria bacterium]NIM72101.1 VWA domain-containing protein [Gammaproteobacteria bacterium]NIN38382.1 VWA domain-containing protein [Gammaproteobacteria bacterium]NIO23828.1 VWA domain-containing protein [Gammaproteobacteria bacterium]NIO64470.1 VWA domain-containing protein [Gammaproteobacteria bacterium]